MSVSLPIPAKSPGSVRSDAEHEATYQAYIVDGLSAEVTARRINQKFGTNHGANAIVSYAARQGWERRGRADKVKATVREEPTALGKTQSRRRTRPIGPKSRVLSQLDPIIGTRMRDGVEVPVIEPSCRFPVGPTNWLRMADQLFCGERQHPAVRPYCLACAAVAHPPQALQRKLDANAS